LDGELRELSANAVLAFVFAFIRVHSRSFAVARLHSYGLVTPAAAPSVFCCYQRLESELRKKSWERDYPTHPDWHLHGSFSEAEVRDITAELTEQTLLWSLPLVGLATLLGWMLARKSLRPIARVNEQLQAKTTANLGQSIELPEIDAEFSGLAPAPQ